MNESSYAFHGFVTPLSGPQVDIISKVDITAAKVRNNIAMLNSRARQLNINFQGSRVGGNIDQNEPLRLVPSSFGQKLMDHGDLKVYVLKIVLWDQKFSILPI